MSGNRSADSTTSTSLTIQGALEVARNSNGVDIPLDPTISAYLERNLADIWRRIYEAQPQILVLTDDEFALFNYFRYRYQYNQLAEQVTATYWNFRRRET